MFTNIRTISVEWGDCDPAGIVFYPRYFAWFNACTGALFAAAGVPSRLLQETHGLAGLPMVDTRARFFIPSTFDDALVVESTLVEFRRSSFDIRHRLMKNAVLAVECTETRVWTVRDPKPPHGLRSQAVPADVIARFQNV